jgi:hypothetical protein
MAVCLTPQGCLLSAADSFWGGLADAVKTAAGQMVTTLFGWWTTSPSIDLNAALVHTAQNYVTAWIAVPVAVLAVLAAVAWGVLAGGIAWIADIARGLTVFGVVAAGSIPIVAALQDWSTALAKGLLGAVPTRDAGNRIITLLDLPEAGPLIVIFWGVVLLLAAAIQYLLMLFRDGAVLVLTAVLPLAAAGQFNRASTFWLPKVAGWLLAFIFIKPAAALIYYLGLNLLGHADGVQALATAVCVMIAAIFAMPAMLRLVTFAVTAAPMGSGALAGAATVSGIGASIAHVAAVRSAQPAATGAAGAAATGATATSIPAGAAFAAASSVKTAATNAVQAGKDAG